MVLPLQHLFGRPSSALVSLQAYSLISPRLLSILLRRTGRFIATSMYIDNLCSKAAPLSGSQLSFLKYILAFRELQNISGVMINIPSDHLTYIDNL